MDRVYPDLVAAVGECCNCGDTHRPVVARSDMGAMCYPCWCAEWAYMERHFTPEECDGDHRREVCAVFAEGPR